MKSMTGYGRGECARDGFNVTVELSSVNRKQAEISVNLPRELEMLETRIRETILEKVSRGRVTTRVTVHAGNGKSSARMHLNVPLAKAYTRELNRLAKIGILEQRNRELWITDVDRLAALVHDAAGD